jgi:hypothetical protein
MPTEHDDATREAIEQRLRQQFGEGKSRTSSRSSAMRQSRRSSRNGKSIVGRNLKGPYRMNLRTSSTTQSNRNWKKLKPPNRRSVWAGAALRRHLLCASHFLEFA